MAKPTLRSATVPVVPREEGFLTMRRSISNDVKAIFTVHDTHIGLVNDTADLTVNGTVYVSAGAKGVLKLPDGNNTIQAGENVVVEYDESGAVKISTQAGQDISYILTTVQGFDSRITKNESDISSLSSQQSANSTAIQLLQSSVGSIQTQNTTILDSFDTISNAFASFESRVGAAEITVQSVLTSEAAQNSRLTMLEDGLYEERLARTNSDYTLTGLVNSLTTNLNNEISSRSTKDTILQTSASTLASSLTDLSSSFSSRLTRDEALLSSASSSFAYEISNLKSLLLENAGIDTSFILSLNELSSSLSSRFFALEGSISSVSSSLSSEIETLRSEIAANTKYDESLQTTLDSLDSRLLTLEYASGSFVSSFEEIFSSFALLSGSLSLEIGGVSDTVTSLSSSVAYEINDLRVNGGGGSRNATVGQFSFNESLAGVIDGVNDTFELSNVPTPPSSLMLFHNGQLMRSGGESDYVLNGKIITFVNGSVPKPDDVVIATYQYVTAAKSFSFNESVVLVMTGEVMQGVLEFEPDPPNSLMLFYNGQLLSAGAAGDYTLSGKNVEVTSTKYEQDDVCLATYSHY